MCLDCKKINAFCRFYSIMHSLGLQDIIVDNVVSKNRFFAKCPHACLLCQVTFNVKSSKMEVREGYAMSCLSLISEQTKLDF